MKAISLLSFPILTHLLSPTAYGVAALAFSIISILSIFAVMGQDTSLVKHYHDAENFDVATVSIFFERFGIISGFIFGVLGSVIWLSYHSFSLTVSNFLVSIIIGLVVWGTSIATFIQTIARLQGYYGRLALSLVLSGICGLAVSVGTAIWWQANEIALMVAGLAPWVVIFTLPRKNPNGITYFQNINQIWKLIRIGLPMTFNACGFWVIASLDRWFLSAFVGVGTVGLYSVATTIATLGQVVTTALLSVWNPEVFRNISDDKVDKTKPLSQALTIFIWILLTTWFVIGSFGGSIIVILAADEFHSAARFVPWIAFGYMVYGISQLFVFSFMISNNTNRLPLFWLAGTIISIGLNLILIQDLNIWGTIIAQSTAFLAIALMTFIFGKNYTSIQPDWALILLVFSIYFLILFGFFIFDFKISLGFDIVLRSLTAILAISFSGWIVIRNNTLLDLRQLFKRAKRRD